MIKIGFSRYFIWYIYSNLGCTEVGEENKIILFARRFHGDETKSGWMQKKKNLYKLAQIIKTYFNELANTW